MFTVLFAELRPLLFRYRLRGHKDESVEFELDFLAPHPGFAFRWQHAIHLRLQIYNVRRSFEIGVVPGLYLGLEMLDSFPGFCVLDPKIKQPANRRMAFHTLKAGCFETLTCYHSGSWLEIGMVPGLRVRRTS